MCGQDELKDRLDQRASALLVQGQAEAPLMTFGEEKWGLSSRG